MAVAAVQLVAIVLVAEVSVCKMRCLYSGDYPCGKCPACLANRQRGFMFRLDQEKEFSSFYFWLTLTYDPEHVPRTKSGDLCFDKTHCRNFFEHTRIKYRTEGVSFKHFLVCEYGGNGTKRPHYHCLLMVYCPDNMSVQEMYHLRHDMREYLINQAWKYGHVTEKSFHGRVLRYLTKYCCKPEIIGDYHEMAPFTLISPGIGERYLETLSSARLAQMKENLDFTVHYGSGKIHLPRYHMEKILPSSTAAYKKAVELNDWELANIIRDNRNLKLRMNYKMAQASNLKKENNFINPSLPAGIDSAALVRNDMCKRDYQFTEFATKMRQRKNL